MPRQEFSVATKREIARRSGCVCERYRWRSGEVCTKPAKVFDHLHPDALGGAPTAENGAHLCLTCNAEKTGQHDVPTIARCDLRRDRLVFGIKPKSRPFPCGRNAPFKKKIDGSVVRRSPS